MNDDTHAPDQNTVLFMQLVSMLAMTALQQMGKLIHPATGKAEADLEAAQATIDLLDMLEAKTRGNLSDKESKLLQDTLMSLKLNFVESRERPPAAPAAAPGGAGEPASSSQAADAGSDRKDNEPGPSPKFRKTYG